LNFLNVIVCIKQVPDPQHLSKITIDPISKTIRREDVPAVINPLDKHALEEGLRIRDKYGGRVIVLSMCPPQAELACREALAMGADEAILLCDRAFAGADTLSTSYSLSLAIKRIGGFNMILCGNETVDGSTGQVPPQLADFLNVPHVTRARKIEFTNEGMVRVERSIEYGYMVVEVTLPAVIAVTKEINVPRIPTVSGILEAHQREVKVWTAKDIEAEEEKIGLAGSPTQVVDIFSPEIGRKGEILKGEPEEVVKLLVQRLHELGVI